jgi:Kef-type K+ transport system membrane component KefB
MSDEQIGPIIVLLLVLISAAHLVGHLFSRLRQPRVIGEIIAGVLLGPAIMNKAAPRIFAALFGSVGSGHGMQELLGFISSMGLLLLMFVSGSEVRRLFGRDDRRQVAWLAGVGTVMPFLVAMLMAPLFPIRKLAGPTESNLALLLVIGIAVAVTSIPVISRIFHDLGIMHTRFARLVLAVAVIEDIALWGILAVATTLAKSASLPPRAILWHMLTTITFFAAGLTLMPAILRRVTTSRWNVLASTSPLGYLIAVMFAYCAMAAILGVNLVFAAFLAGYAVARDKDFFSTAIGSLSSFSYAFFIPLYFLLVGFRLKLDGGYSVRMLLIFLLVACGIKLMSVGLGATLAGFRGLDVLNLALATNARGGPGIVLATVAYEAGIINTEAFTTLVLVAVFTSQAAGAWLEYVLRKGWPLLSAASVDATLASESEAKEAA